MYFDPYKVLGVPETASDDEIKKAYRSLSRKYHPDSNINNPNREQAEERFKEVQEAYEQIMKIRSGEAPSGNYGPYGQTSGGYQQYNGYQNHGYQNNGYHYRENPFGDFGPFGAFYNRTRTSSGDEPFTYPKEFEPAVNAINNRSFSDALNYLNRLGPESRNATWYYLRANANAGLNYRANAMEDAEMAVRLDPNNLRFRSFYQRLKTGAETYRNTANTYGRSSVTGSDICCDLCLLSLCCPCNGPC